MRGLILTILTFTGLFSQTVRISGNYLDLLNNPIDSAKVTYAADNVIVDSTYTDALGAFTLDMSYVSTEPEVPSSFHLSQNYPNPFNPSTRINLATIEPGTFTIYDIRGALVEFIDLLSAGQYEITWGGKNLPAGLYLYVLRSESAVQCRKMTLLDGGDGSGLSVLHASMNVGRSLSKASSLGELTITKLNTTPLEISFDSPQADTSLGILNGNVGPRQIQTIRDTIMYEGDTLSIDWDDYFYNDSETFYPPQFVEFMYLTDTTFYDADVVAIDVLDTNLVTVSNTFGVTWLSTNTTPYLYFGSSIDTIVYNADLPVYLASLNYEDFDGDSCAWEFFQSDSDNVFLSVEEIPGGGNPTGWWPMIHLDSIASGFSGTIEYGATVTDPYGASVTTMVPLVIMPQPDYIPITFVFKAVYDDTLLWNGTSTVKYRLMNPSGEIALWGGDSIATSDNGVVTVSLMEDQQYSIRSRHTEEYNLSIKVSYYKKPGTPGTIGQESKNSLMPDLRDTLNVMNFSSSDDTIWVLKIMEDFPLYGIGTYPILQYVDPNRVGFRRLPPSQTIIPIIGNLNYTPLNDTQINAVMFLIEQWSSIPQVELAGYFNQSEIFPQDSSFIGISIDPGFQWASNAAFWDDETNIISRCTILGRPYLIGQPLIQEITECFMDTYDINGLSPPYVYNDGMLTEYAKQTICLVYLSRPGTLF